MTIESGAVLSCSDEECGCEIVVRTPCPHGDTYTCACGHALHAEGRDPLPPTPGA